MSEEVQTLRMELKMKSKFRFGFKIISAPDTYLPYYNDPNPSRALDVYAEGEKSIHGGNGTWRVEWSDTSLKDGNDYHCAVFYGEYAERNALEYAERLLNL